MTKPARNRQDLPQRGFTLVEAMVALLVLSIGLLGIAALYVETLRANRTSLYRTVAVNLATDIGDKMRSNRDPVDAYDCGGTCEAGEGGNDIADEDLAAWIADVEGQLPAGEGSIVFTAPTATTPAIYEVNVSWTEPGQADAIAYELRVEI